MKRYVSTLTKWNLLLATALWISPVLAQNAAALSTQNRKDSYAIGADLARNLKRQGLPLDVETLLQAMRDEFSGAKLQMSDDDLRETLRMVQTEQRRKMVLARGGAAAVGEENRAQGEAFLTQNKTNANVVTLPSGLQYQILKAGNGPKPTGTNVIECHFRGTLVDGKEFAGSAPAKPASFKMNDVIRGWKEALQLMPVGSKWRLFIPPQLAFGEQGVGHARLAPRIGPNATLIYELELLAIK